MKRMVGVLLIGLAPHRTQSSQARSHILCSAVLTPDPILPGLFLPCSLPQLLTAVAGGGLEPSPVRRFRGPPLIDYSATQDSRLSLTILLMAHLEYELQT